MDARVKPGHDECVCVRHSDSRHSFTISRPDRPEVCRKFPYPPTRGRGEAGRPMRPIAACAMIVVERTRVIQVTPESPGTPRAMVLTAYSVLSPATGLFCHRRLARLLARLDASVGASGPHAFAVRLKRFRQRRHPRPPHPRPALMTLRNAPLSGTGWQII
jgi:hypothetical protein